MGAWRCQISIDRQTAVAGVLTSLLWSPDKSAHWDGFTRSCGTTSLTFVTRVQHGSRSWVLHG
jgi:hypothetical protein